MAIKRYRKRIVFAELEASYGVAETLVAADAIRTKGLALNGAYAGDRITRDLDRDDLGAEASININPHKGLTWDVELHGSGTAGTAPPYRDLLLAAGWAETIDPGVSVTYNPVSDPTDSVTLGLYLDGELHSIPGARADWELHMERGIPFIRFNFMGLYTTPVAGSPPTPDFAAYAVTPVPMTDANTPTVTIGAFNAILHSLTATGNQALVPRNVPNSEEILQTDRQITGTIVLDRPDISVKDIYSDNVESHDGVNTSALQIVHGTAAGNICTINGAALQLEDVTDQDQSGIAVSSFAARYCRGATEDNELTLVFT